MPEGETLPKEKTYKAYMEHAEIKRKQAENYLNKRLLGIGPKLRSTSDDEYRMIKSNEMSARAQGIKFLQAEQARNKKLRGMERGGKVRATGKRMLHRGEAVARKKSRSCGR